MEIFQRGSALPNIKYNYAVLFCESIVLGTVFKFKIIVILVDTNA